MNPPSRPSIEKTFAPLLLANFAASIRGVDTAGFVDPPPTLKIKSASLLVKRQLDRKPVNIVSQPSSFALAVSSLTLSEGEKVLISHNYRKSLTACDEWPALPPNPQI